MRFLTGHVVQVIVKVPALWASSRGLFAPFVRPECVVVVHSFDNEGACFPRATVDVPANPVEHRVRIMRHGPFNKPVRRSLDIVLLRGWWRFEAVLSWVCRGTPWVRDRWRRRRFIVVGWRRRWWCHLRSRESAACPEGSITFITDDKDAVAVLSTLRANRPFAVTSTNGKCRAGAVTPFAKRSVMRRSLHIVAFPCW